VVLDPGSDPVSAERALQQLLEQKRVFALIAPLAPMLDQRLTTLLAPQNVPMVGSTPRSGGSAQIFDPLPGLPEQLLSLAGHARVALGLAPDEAVVYAGNEHAALAEQVRERLRQQGWVPPAIQAFDGQAVDGQGIVFGRAQAFAELAAALQAAGREPYLFAASSQVAGAVARLPAQWSRRFLAYPTCRGLDRARPATLAGLQQRQGLDPRQASLQVNTLCALRLLSEALKQIGRDASREQLIAALEGLHDVPTGLTPALGFGPGRRQGMAGAHVVAVALPGHALLRSPRTGQCRTALERRLPCGSCGCACCWCWPASWADVPAARVNGVEIGLMRLERYFSEYLDAQGRAVTSIRNPGLYKRLRDQALDELIDKELLWQEAQRQGIAVSDEHVSAQVGEIEAASAARRFRTAPGRGGLRQGAVH
jgi:hypothetical protein